MRREIPLVWSNDAQMEDACQPPIQSTDRHIDSTEKRSISQDLELSLRLWIRLVLFHVPRALGLGLLVVASYLPLRFLSLQDWQELYFGLYFYVFSCILQFALACCVICGLFNIFGKYIARRLALRVCAPVFVLQVLTLALSNLSIAERRILQAVLSLMHFLSFVVARYQKPPVQEQRREEVLRLLGDGTPLSLTKAFIAGIISYHIFTFLLKLYLKATLLLRILIRVVAVPILISGLSMYQQLLVVKFNDDLAHTRYQVGSSINSVFQFIGRVMISNSGGSVYDGSMIYMNAAVSFVEILTRVSYRLRMKLYYRFLSITQRLIKFIQRYKTPALVRDSPVEFTSIPNLSPDTSTSSADHGSITDPQDSLKIDASSTARLRAMHLREDMGTEFRVSILVPILLFMLDPLFYASEFVTISSINECLGQIFIQIGFEFVSDLLCMFVEIRYLRLPLTEIGPEKSSPSNIRFFVNLYSILLIHFILFAAENYKLQ